VTFPFLFRGQQILSWHRTIGCITLLCLIRSCSLATQAQSSKAPQANLSFPVRLDGGSKGVPSHLPGTIYVSTDRIEFQAFPQVEGIIWSCKQIETLSVGKDMVTLETGHAKYRVNLKSSQQATAFVEETQSACENSGAPIARPNARQTQ
jgi:hypothetical protein